MEQCEYQIRRAVASDYNELGQVMFEAVRQGDSPYTELQRKAWVESPRSGDDWNKRLMNQTVFLAECDEKVHGFMTIDQNGNIDLAFIRLQSRGVGIFRLLYDSIECEAKRAGFKELVVHASLMARPAFEAVGFRVTDNERVIVRDVAFDRFRMAKQIHSTN